MDDDRDGPVPSSLLADPQAGLRDDDAAARLRHRARSEPAVAGRLAAVNRVRRDVAALGVDAESAPEVPAEVTARVLTALRSLPAPAMRPVGESSAGRWRRVAAIAGVLAAAAAAGVGSVVLLRDDTPTATAIAAARSPSPAPRAPGGVPLSDGDMLELLTRPADEGPLAAPQRLESCLSGLGYPTSTSPLGARTLAVNGRPGVLLLLADELPRRINVVVVSPNCSSIDTGLLASTVVGRP